MTNFTKETTFLKFMFQGQKMAVYLVSLLLNILVFAIDDGVRSMTLGGEIFVIFLLNVGWVAIVIDSFVEWNKEKSKS